MRDADCAGKFMHADAARLAQRFDAFRGVTSLTLFCQCVKLLLVTVWRLFTEPPTVTCGIMINPQKRKVKSLFRNSVFSFLLPSAKHIKKEFVKNGQRNFDSEHHKAV